MILSASLPRCFLQTQENTFRQTLIFDELVQLIANRYLPASLQILLASLPPCVCLG